MIDLSDARVGDIITFVFTSHMIPEAGVIVSLEPHPQVGYDRINVQMTYHPHPTWPRVDCAVSLTRNPAVQS